MNSKIIAILTLQNSNNYGAMYQAYALSRFLEKKGHQVLIVDYDMTRDNAGIYDYLKHPMAFFQKIAYRKEQISNKLFNRSKSTTIVSRGQEFEGVFNDFRNLYLTITKNEYDYQKMLTSCPEADVYICGSDQVWAADFLFTSPAFLLGFVPEESKRVAYAASFGKSNLESYLKNIFTKYINKFDAVSVREQSGVAIVNNYSQKPATHVLDPTLLLNKEDYSEIIDYSLVPDEPYVFVYKLNHTKELSDWMDACINTVSRQKGLSVLAVSTNLVYPFDEKWLELHPTPGQLLGLIEKSEVVMTNSFHGIVFSIILQKIFFAFARDVFKDKQNLRIIELLKSLDLEDFYCPPFYGPEEVNKKLVKAGGYQGVDAKLNILRSTSEEFLHDAVN